MDDTNIFFFNFAGKHVEVAKHLILNGAKLDAKTSVGLAPMDFVSDTSEIWTLISDALKGDMPELEDIPDVPEIPDYALPEGAEGKKKKKGKKGKKGKKSGKKKGGKKKSGKKKKKK